ncbi:MAG: hypothetical protein KDA37_17700 [Planctomycetales bacterium]|nr:hypothetical protein [Planctomycetales bacterium]
MTPESRNPTPESRSRLARYAAIAVAGYTLVWLAGCGEPVDVKAVQQAKQQAVVDAQAAWDAKLAEGPTPIVREDFWNIEPKSEVSGMRVGSQAALMAKNTIEMDFQIRHNLEIRAADPAYGWPKSHEEFLKIVRDEWRMPIPRLKEPYEVWYNADTHEIMKRPKPDASPTPVEESPRDPSGKPTFQ